MTSKRGRKPMFPWIADMATGDERFIHFAEYQKKTQMDDRSNTDLAALARIIAYKAGVKCSVSKSRGPEGVWIKCMGNR